MKEQHAIILVIAIGAIGGAFYLFAQKKNAAAQTDIGGQIILPGNRTGGALGSAAASATTGIINGVEQVGGGIGYALGAWEAEFEGWWNNNPGYGEGYQSPTY